MDLDKEFQKREFNLLSIDYRIKPFFLLHTHLYDRIRNFKLTVFHLMHMELYTVLTTRVISKMFVCVYLFRLVSGTATPILTGLL